MNHPTRIVTVFGTMLAMACGGGGGGGGGDGGPTNPGPVKPTVASVSPDPVPAGQPVTINGQNLVSLALVGMLTPAATSVSLGQRSLTIQSESATRIESRVPLDMPPGTYGLVVSRDGVNSEPHDLAVELFDITGTYDGPIPFRNGTCAGAPATRPTVLEIVDNRPAFTVTLDGVELDATFTAEPVSSPPQWRMTASGTVGDENVTIAARVFYGRAGAQAEPLEQLNGDLTVEPQDGSCFSEYRMVLIKDF